MDQWLADLVTYVTGQQQRARQQWQTSGPIPAGLWWLGHGEAWADLAGWLLQHPLPAGADTGADSLDRRERARLMRRMARWLEQAITAEGGVQVWRVQAIASALEALANLDLSSQ